MASKAYPNVYLESMEATGDPGNESNQVRNQTVQGTPVGQCEQRILGSRRKRYNAASGTHMQPSQSRLSLPNGLLCSIAQNVRNRRMPNGTYGGVRGRETKVGRKLSFSSYSIINSCLKFDLFSQIFVYLGFSNFSFFHKILDLPIFVRIFLVR